MGLDIEIYSRLSGGFHTRDETFWNMHLGKNKPEAQSRNVPMVLPTGWEKFTIPLSQTVCDWFSIPPPTHPLPTKMSTASPSPNIGPDGCIFLALTKISRL